MNMKNHNDDIISKNIDVLTENMNIFRDYEPEFYRYMVLYGKLAPKTSKDYISRLRFLSQTYILDDTISEEYVDYIMKNENLIRLNRQKYATSKAMSDFHSGLTKFLAFINSTYYKDSSEILENEIRKVNENSNLTKTERTSIIQSRVGQGTFRSSLIRYWKGCSISNCPMTPVLIASHIKPWCDCNNIQRLDFYNGLLLLPNYDKLFDKGYISFDSKGHLISSRLLDKEVKDILGIKDGMSLRKLDDKHLEYLKYHNEYRFMG